MEQETQNLLLPRAKHAAPPSNFFDDDDDPGLKTFSFIFLILSQSNVWRSGLSWSLFFVLTVFVPLLSHIVFQCKDCDYHHRRPFDLIVQISLSVFSTLSFACLSCFARWYGLRRFLFLDKLCDVSDKVRRGYADQLHRSLKLLCSFVIPCFLVDSAYKIWWFSSGGKQIPYFLNVYLSDIIACTLLLCSWLYRTSLFFLVCVLFSLTCSLQILRLDDFAQVFEKHSDVGSILMEHLAIRRNLRILSHRFRVFILFTLILVTASQFASLLVATETSSIVNISTAGELALCSVTLVTGLCICLRSAAKITHKAQSVTSLAAKWHTCATINTFDDVADHETPPAHNAFNGSYNQFPVYLDSDNEEGDGDDPLDNSNIIPIYRHTISYQKRQALVTYLENNRAGITVFGFMLDRSSLHTIFAIQLSLTLWILNKTIGFS